MKTRNKLNVTDMTKKKAPQNVLTEAICQSQRMISTKLQTGSEAGSKRQSKSVVEVVDDGVPYDVGWAWMIVLAGFINFVITSGYNRATFMFFVRFLDAFNAHVTETTLLFGVKSAVNSVVGLFAMNAMVGGLGVRKTVFIGSVCLGLSAILGSFANDITSLVLSQAVFHGLGMSMLNMPITVLIGYYFRRRRSLANAITKCGVGVGAVAFPPITTYFLEEYGLRGSLLLMGGICLNTLIATALLRPTTYYTKRRQKRSEQLTADNCEHEETGKLLPQTITDVVKDAKDKADNSAPTTTSDLDPDLSKVISCLQTSENSKTFRDHFHPDKGIALIAGQKRCPSINRHTVLRADNTPGSQTFHSMPELFSKTPHDLALRRTLSDNEKDDVVKLGKLQNLINMVSESNVAQYFSLPGVEQADSALLYVKSKDDCKDKENTGPSCVGAVRRFLKKMVHVLDFSLYRSPMFRLLTVFFLFSPLVTAIANYLPAMAQQSGLSERQAAILLSIIGGLDFVSRLMFGFIADLKIVKVSSLIGISFAILGAVCQLTRLFTSFPLLVVLAVADGLLSGVAACLIPILIMDDIGLEQTAKALGFHKLFSGAAMAVFHPLLGYIRDLSGSYHTVYNVIGFLTLLSAAIVFCIRFVPHKTPQDQKYIIMTTVSSH